MPSRTPLAVTSILLAGVVSGLVVASAPADAEARRPPVTRTVVRGIDVDRTTIPRLQRAMNHHRLTSVQLTRFYLARIQRLNPRLHAVITTSRTATLDAAAADRARRQGVRKPLLGIPLIVKDNIDTTGMPTTAGSLALAGSTPPDAFLVQRLEAQGAIVIAKANLSEWANYRSTKATSGWSAVGGQTHNPYVLDRNPCGSSSGSAVSSAADLATVAVGTETDGSIVCPSGQNGVVGIKPTLGLVSRSGVVPISAQQDTAGPIARNTTDAAVVLGALTGVDPTDPATAAQRGHVSRYTTALRSHALRGARIGVWRKGNFGLSKPTDKVMRRTIKKLRHLGATIVDPANLAIEKAYDPENTALQYEFKHDVAQYLQRWTAPTYPKTLADLIAFDDAHASTELRYFGQDIFTQSQARGPVTDPAYLRARRDATTIARRSIDQTLRRYRLDAVIAPTNSPAWRTTLGKGDAFLLGSSSPSAISGYPSISVPAGYAGRLPVGVSFIGARWSERTLISLASSWERATHVRHKPRYRAR
jgi:amidase